MRLHAHRTALLTLAIGVLASTAVSAAETPTVAFVSVAAGERSAILSPQQIVVRDQEAWIALWRRHSGDASVTAPLIDFQTSMVLAVFAGRAPASTTVAIVRILSEPDRLVVQYRVGERRPITDAGQEVTPFHIVRVRRSALRVSFQRVKTIPVLPAPGS